MKRLLARAVLYLYAQTFNATGFSRADVLPRAVESGVSIRGANVTKECTMPTEDLATLLNDFQGAYGRLCLLTCQALSSGADKTTILRAFNGDVLSHATKIVEAYRRCDIALKGAQPCGETAIVERAHATRKAIEGEWMVEIDPRVTVR